MSTHKRYRRINLTVCVDTNVSCGDDVCRLHKPSRSVVNAAIAESCVGTLSHPFIVAQAHTVTGAKLTPSRTVMKLSRVVQKARRIVRDEDVLGGEPRVAGKRLGVLFIKEHVEDGGLEPRVVADRYDLE